MMKVIGAKRVFTIVVLIALNALLGAGFYLYLVPEKFRQEQNQRALNGQISTVQGDINRMQIEFDQLEIQQAEFEKLRAKGFFNNQGRRQAEKIFEAIQKQAGVVSVVANIQAGTVEESEEAMKAEHKILVSPINLKIESMDDVDVYRYLYLMKKFFPGHIAIKKINLERKAEVSGTVLRSIASGSNPQLVQADIEMLWRTMIPAKDIIGAEVTATP